MSELEDGLKALQHRVEELHDQIRELDRNGAEMREDDELMGEKIKDLRKDVDVIVHDDRHDDKYYRAELKSLREQVVRLSEMWQMANACSNVSELGRGYLLIVREIIEWLDAQGGDTQQVKFVSSAEEMSDSIIAGMPKVRAHRSKKRRFATPESESSTV